MPPASWDQAGEALFRVPLLPRARARDAWLDPDDDPEALRCQIERLAADPLLRDAIDVASTGLAHRIDRVLDGRETDVRKLRQTFRALISYQLRAAGRCTPFGLFAAVGRVRWADGPLPSAQGDRVGPGGRRKGVRPDSGWLAGAARRLELDERSPEHLRVVVNNLCISNGDRLVLAAGDQGARGPQRTLRLTAAVRAALELAGGPIRRADLEFELAERFPGTSGTRITELVRGLIECEVLLTELRPSLHSMDPFAALLGHLQDTELGACAVVKQMEEAQRAAADYAAQPLGVGRAAWRAATELLDEDGCALHVDTAVNAPLLLPASVLHDVEEAADVLWRLSPATDTCLADYHRKFLERYGVDALVPLLDLLDPATGLGPPAGYRLPASPRERTAASPSPPPRDRLLAKLCGQLALGRAPRELVIDEALLGSCEHRPGPRDAPEDGTADASGLSVELYGRLIAESEQHLAQGSYRMVLLPDAGGVRAGSGFGRFAYLFPGTSPAAALDGPELVQLAHPVVGDRLGNVARVPLATTRRAALGVFPDEGLCDALDAADLEIGADPRRFLVYSRKWKKEISAVVFHLLNQRVALPNAVRFLLEASRHGRRTWQPWDWGTLAASTYLPAVRWGRVVLSEARWRVDDHSLRDASASDAEWRARFALWRRRWEVPDHVSLGVFDHRLPLNLTFSSHQDLVRRDLRQHPSDVVLYPDPYGGRPDHGWLRGEQGAYEVEVAIPLAPRKTSTGGTRSERLALPPRRGQEAVHLAGGGWLYARIACPTANQQEVLATYVAQFVGRLPPGVERWFFTRYADPVPHLRIRFQGESGILHGDLLRSLHRMCARLRTEGLASDLELATYRPEIERYGGAEALPWAEAFFDADSRHVLEHLRAARGADLIAFGAADLAELVFAFSEGRLGPDEDRPAAWRAAFGPRDDRYHEAYKRRRKALAGLIALPSPGIGRASPWHDAAAAYGRALGSRARAEPWIRFENCLESLMHMHCNRLFGISRDAEAEAAAAARGAVNAVLDRAGARE